MDSSSSFDPYLMWLGIRHPERPPNHYRLLGVELFETDLDVIASAADRQMAHVRRFQNGERSELSQRILNELAAARVCLLRSLDKKIYDATLQDALERETLSNAFEASSSTSYAESNSAAWVKLQREAVWRRRMMQVIVVLMALTGLGLVVVGLRFPGSSRAMPRPVSTSPGTIINHPSGPIGDSPPATDLPRQPQNEHSGETDPPQNPVPEMTAPEVSPSVKGRKRARMKLGEEPAAQPPIDPGDNAPRTQEMEPHTETQRTRAGWTSALVRHPDRGGGAAVRFVSGRESTSTYARLRQAIENRDLAAAWTEWKALGDEVRTFEQRESVDRIRVLLFQLERFWQAVDEGLQLLKTGAVLRFQNQQLKIVEVTSERVTIELAGKNQVIDRDHRKMDASFACLMVTLAISAQGGPSQPLVTAFLEVDAAADKEAARQLRKELSAQGFRSL